MIAKVKISSKFVNVQKEKKNFTWALYFADNLTFEFEYAVEIIKCYFFKI